MAHLNSGLTRLDGFDRWSRDADSGCEEFLRLTPGDSQITDSLAQFSECE